MEKLNFNLNKVEQSEEKTSNPGEKPPMIAGITKDRKTVYINPGSHFHSEDGITYELLESAISQIDTGDEPRVESQISFDRPIGFDKCVETEPEDEIIMVYRKGRNGQTPMVKGRQPVETNKLQVIIKQKRTDANTYILATTFAGEKAPREPWDPSLETESEKQESKDFWNTHALIYNEELIDFDRTNLQK